MDAQLQELQAKLQELERVKKDGRAQAVAAVPAEQVNLSNNNQISPEPRGTAAFTDTKLIAAQDDLAYRNEREELFMSAVQP